jgi:hypothetical protein
MACVILVDHRVGRSSRVRTGYRNDLINVTAIGSRAAFLPPTEPIHASEDDQDRGNGSQIAIVIAPPALDVACIAVVPARSAESKISGRLLPAWSMPHASAVISDRVRACSAPQDDRSR